MIPVAWKTFMVLTGLQPCVPYYLKQRSHTMEAAGYNLGQQ